MGLFRAWTRASRFQTIRNRLALALAIALLPVLALGALQAVGAYNREADHQRLDLAMGAQRVASTAQARLESAISVLETLQSETTGAACAPRLEALSHRLQGYQAFIRYSATGVAVCASQGAGVPAPALGAAWFRRLREGDPMVLTRTGSTALTAVRIERPEGTFDGAYVALLPLSELRPGQGQGALPPGAEVAVADGSGHILNATHADAFGAPPPARLVEARRNGSAWFYARDGQGHRRLFSAAPLVQDDAFVILSASTQGVFSWARLNPLASFVLPFIAWCLAVGAVLIVAERVVIRWLGYLERIASIYAKGRFSVRPVQARNAPLEIRNLAHTLDQMADAIDRRDAELRESLAHKDALMREIHHRVKNNLQVISSLLNMQQRSLTDPAARAAMSDTRQRITALALIYRALYQSPDLRRVDVRSFLEELISQLVAGDTGRSGPLVRSELEADPLVIDPDKLAPLALWAVEAITNAQKHAFDGRGGMLRVRFKVEREESTLEVEDDGPGMAEAEAALDQGVGRTLMTAFARQLRGRAEIVRGPQGGLLARLSFPTPEASEQMAEDDDAGPDTGGGTGNKDAA